MTHVLLLDMAIHTFDAARLISSADPVGVYCHEWNPAGSWYDRDASAAAIFEMSNGWCTPTAAVGAPRGSTPPGSVTGEPWAPTARPLGTARWTFEPRWWPTAASSVPRWPTCRCRDRPGHQDRRPPRRHRRVHRRRAKRHRPRDGRRGQHQEPGHGLWRHRERRDGPPRQHLHLVPSFRASYPRAATAYRCGPRIARQTSQLGSTGSAIWRIRRPASARIMIPFPTVYILTVAAFFRALFPLPMGIEDWNERLFCIPIPHLPPS